MVENNDVQDEIVIRRALKIDAETVIKLICSLAKYQGEGAEFRATIEDVERERELVPLLFGCIALFYGIWVLESSLLFHSIHPLSNDYCFFVLTCGIPRFSFSDFTYILSSIR